MEGSAHLHAMHPIIGAIKIQNQFFGRRGKLFGVVEQRDGSIASCFRPARFSTGIRLNSFLTIQLDPWRSAKAHRGVESRDR